MGLFQGKKGVVLGVANERSIAAHVAKFVAEQGAELAFNFVNERMEPKVRKVAEPLKAKLIAGCDVTQDAEIERFFHQVKETLGTIDFVIHSIAYAPAEDLKGPTLNVSRSGFAQAMDISAYSFIATTRAAMPLMNSGGSVIAMTYFGGEKVVAGYNLMGVCKAALDAAVRYLAYDCGRQQVRVNAVSAGPVRTLASAGISDFKAMLELNAAIAPLQRNITGEEVAKAAAYLLSDMSTAVTGEIHHVDCGYHIMGGPSEGMNWTKDNNQ